MEAQSYTAEERRAANQVWAAAGAYGFEPLFLARNTDGTIDFYMNCIVGLVHKYYGDALVRSLFDTWEGDLRQTMLDDLSWLYLESAVLRPRAARPPGAFGPPPRPRGLFFRHPVQALAAGVDGEEPAGLLHAGCTLAGRAGPDAARHDPLRKEPRALPSAPKRPRAPRS